MTMTKKYVNNDYINVPSRYLESPHSTSNIKYIDKNYKSCDRVIKRGNKNDNKMLSANSNNITSNSFIFKEGNSFYNQNDLFNYKNYNMSDKEILLNNNGNNLINGNINNFINKRNLQIQSQEKNNINKNQNISKNNNDMNKDNPNVKNNHYQYFPSYNNNTFNEQNNSNFSYDNNISNNNNNYIINHNKSMRNKDNYINNKTNFKTDYNNSNNYYNKNTLSEQYNSNMFRNYINNKKCEQDEDIINIRKHLREFYENKKKTKYK